MTPDEQMELMSREVREHPNFNGVKDCKAGVLIRVGGGVAVLGDSEVISPMALAVAAARGARSAGDLVLAEAIDIALEALGTKEAAGMHQPSSACLLMENGLVSISYSKGFDVATNFEGIAKALREQTAQGTVN